MLRNTNILFLLIVIIVKMMKLCPNCSQYHNNNVKEQHKCITYEKFTYLNKDQFIKISKEEVKKAKRTEQSIAIHPSQERFYTAQKDRHEEEPEDHQNQKTVKNRTTTDSHLQPFDKTVDRRIQNVISKSKGCRKSKKSCEHMMIQTSRERGYQIPRTTGRQDDIEIEDEDEIEFKDEVETEVSELFIPPTEQIFQKPFNSLLFAALPPPPSKSPKKKIVYDSLRDNRFCGIVICDEGEVDLEEGQLVEIVQKMQKVQ